MSALRFVAPALFAVAALGTPCTAVLGAEGGVPSARDVVVRGRTELADALRIAAREAWQGAAPREVTIVVDVTPYTQAWEDRLVEALFDVEVNGGNAAGWRIAPLGGKAGERVPAASGLAPQLASVFAEETDETSTTDALARTMRSVGGRDAVFVYLADWRFEDEHGMEGLLQSLRSSGRTLSVVGSEAAYGRGWIDGFAEPGASPDRREPYVEGVGRDPFSGGDADAPWHGGDTAYPHVPWRFAQPRWHTTFPPERDLLKDAAGRRSGRLEDLRERLREEVVPRDAFATHPLPSSWGPYGLMRMAALTGGRYVLWSWNPDGRAGVTYDWSRCDLFPPDLRSRDAIRADLARRPLAAALAKAWDAAASRDVATVTVSPPISRTLRGTREMLAVNEQDGLPWAWLGPEGRDDFVRRAEKARDGLDGALRTLDDAIAGTPPHPDDVDMRHLADAHHLAHALRAQRFALGEALAVARGVRDEELGEDTMVMLEPRVFVPEGRDPERVRSACEPLAERVLGDRLLEERRRLLTRYAGTPPGETVARNPVVSYTTRRAPVPSGTGAPGGSVPGESGGQPAPTTGGPSGGSSGGGTPTGR